MTKRAISPTPTTRRIKPDPINMSKLTITNLNDSEVIHQACTIVSGKCPNFDYAEETNFITISSSDDVTQTSHTQNWPVAQGKWKALVMLSPGENKLIFNLHHVGAVTDTIELKVTYQPLLQLPPLHLAILVAKDSPLLMDCPSSKYGGISTAHSSIEAAISKLRLSAYMWQALTAEDMRQKGLGRRSFRLDEEWAPNTNLQMTHQYAHAPSSTHMGSVAKVHIVKSERTVAQLRDSNVAQQNHHGSRRDALHEYFEAALKAHGPPFDSSCRPVVAGMMLDSHYDTDQSLILGHAALGCHKPDGISLGIFGSHLAYSWPRFMEEIPACLTDVRPTGDTVGNDNGECDTMRNACFVGQGAFLHEVGHAFGADHTTGIMARGYSKDWGRNFLANRSDGRDKNEAKWDLQDVLRFKLLPHFRLPGDDPSTKEFKNAEVRIEVAIDSDYEDDENENDGLVVSSSGGLARVSIQNGDDEENLYNILDHKSTHFILRSIRTKFDNEKPLKIHALAMNGKVRVVDAWKLLGQGRSYIRIPNSDIKLRKQSAISTDFNESDDGEFQSWAFLLRERGADGQLHRATSIDLRVGCIMDGAVVYYADGHHANCGPMRNRRTGQAHSFGGHASESHDIPANETITKVEVATRSDPGWGTLAGIRMTLSNGDSWGHLNADEGSESVVTLQPREDEVIIGLYGNSCGHSGFTFEFGILTAPESVDLPEQVYNMSELKNSD
ncbi:putative peptidase family-domain-containing protein [Talaromyces proteolyticus]|uniref:Peptidase family-domain-containing protein n=1 Tax=Talaromyces proteolyticus TaxID=1131652 RepID=A0AAD4KKG6_9EURO|nr:putative peptidase family-domain-containing protein [Talaromyces proteolyticus]KAH8690259.1 putative peptidase family-domain-containing protein [Talaromyces proteolyticus]